MGSHTCRSDGPPDAHGAVMTDGTSSGVSDQQPAFSRLVYDEAEGWRAAEHGLA